MTPRCTVLGAARVTDGSDMERGVFEAVYVVTDWLDGPRSGITSCEGRPHSFEMVFDEVRDEFQHNEFDLVPVGDDTLRLALEQHEMWKRWQRAFQAGEVSLTSHPALPADRAAFDELGALVSARIKGAKDKVFRMRAEFRAVEGAVRKDEPLEVRWSNPPRTP